ncbi:ATP-binding protein [Nostoc sp. LEGE 06077]|uniref:ATP-binding protein n=1 Tax=Nostoc sp. LEGE 06077 TaxID=915325 RepID=UPI003A0FE367
MTKTYKRILVVDDSITVREMERKLLENNSYQVDVAVNGMDGWNAVRGSDYDLVITDIDMPRMNGFELTKQIKSHAKLKQLIQTEKMSSLGRMVGGLAHEINNPISFIHGNFNYLHEHIHTLLRLIQMYQKEYPEAEKFIENEIGDIDLDFIIDDFQKILSSMRVGTDRIKDIVLSLRNFSRLDQADKKAVNIHDGIESTLFLLNHRLKQEIEIIKEYANLPLVECYPAELNQVFLNVINNAIDALLENKNADVQKQIIIRTEGTDSKTIKVRIIDNGAGINSEIQSRIFDPFFTTKPVNKGTGLGLAISYQIIEKHHGSIDVKSELGNGAEFIIEIPVSINS